jgi:starvation-inducible DNA-binding protein
VAPRADLAQFNGELDMHSTRINLPEGSRQQLIELLNARLAEVLDLHQAVKTAHWNVRGPDFFQLHELFDKVAEVAEDFGDDFAERAGQLGGVAEGTTQAIRRRSQMPEYPLNISSGREHVTAVADRLAFVSNNARAAIDEAGKIGDQGTADLFTEAVRELDKQLWFVEAHLQAER